MTEQKMLAIGESIDRLITVDVPARGVIGKLYDSARKIVGRPLTMNAAEKLLEKTGKNDVVYLLTGFQAPNWGITESDGPIGAIMLARAISIATDAIPVIITDDINLKLTIATSRTAGLNIIDKPKPAPTERLPRSVVVHGIPINSNVQDITSDMFDDDSPSAVISIERPGWNEKELYHNSSGFDISHLNAHFDHFYQEAKNRNVLTIGIGDGGNELGMGNIKETVKEIVPHGAKCQCPCGAGIAASNKSDAIIATTVSNWGGYGIGASLAALTGNFEVLHDRDLEIRVSRKCADEGGLDGVVGYPMPGADGITETVTGGVVDLLASIVKRNLDGTWDTKFKAGI